MIVNIPAYDATYFIKNGMVWGTFLGKITKVYPNVDSNVYMIGWKAVSRIGIVYQPDQFNGYLLPINRKLTISKIYPDNAAYVKTQWQKTFVLSQSNAATTESNDLDATYRSTQPFTAKANAVAYIAPDNPIVDFHVSEISVKETDYTFVPVGGHVG